MNHFHLSVIQPAEGRGGTLKFWLGEISSIHYPVSFLTPVVKSTSPQTSPVCTTLGNNRTCVALVIKLGRLLAGDNTTTTAIWVGPY